MFKSRLTRLATANFFNRSLVHLTNFEPARYLLLENTRVVILLSNTTDKVHVLVPVTAQGILAAIGVVQVDVLVIASDQLCVGIEFLESVIGQVVEQGVIGFVFP